MAVWRSVVRIAHPDLGGTGTNTFHARTTSIGPDTTELEQLEVMNVDLSQMFLAWEQLYAGGAVISHTGEWITVSEEEPRSVAGTSWTFAATGSGDTLPPANSLVITWRTLLAARKGRGRTFIGPLSTSMLQDNGTPTEASRTLVHDAVDDWVATFAGGVDGAFVVWSSLDGGVGRDIITGRTRNLFGSLTSRRD